jgi:hypothetical protein
MHEGPVPPNTQKGLHASDVCRPVATHSGASGSCCSCWRSPQGPVCLKTPPTHMCPVSVKSSRSVHSAAATCVGVPSAGGGALFLRTSCIGQQLLGGVGVQLRMGCGSTVWC